MAVRLHGLEANIPLRYVQNRCSRRRIATNTLLRCGPMFPNSGAQNLEIHRLRNALVIKGDVVTQTLEPGDGSANIDRNLFSWWLLVLGTPIPGITAELKQNVLRIRIPTIAEHRGAEIGTLGAGTGPESRCSG